ncbi:hypothetical protein Golob_025354, partial [Gossypium lobatum]|nr:hypothetical protein [Gossypium lobatum]
VCKSLWLISVKAACWSVWLARNKIVFEKKWSTMNNLLFHFKIWALMWVRFVQEELKYGWVNFNVSRVANEDEVECEGLLRDSNGVARALFLGPVAAKDSITTKAGEIIIALDVYLVMG